MKRLFIVMAIACLPLLSLTQNSTISGVVTYYFNDYQGNKPDLGAKVYLIDTTILTSFKIGVIDTFMLVKSTRKLMSDLIVDFDKYTVLSKKYEEKKKDKELYDDCQHNVKFYKEQIEVMKSLLVMLKCSSDDDFQLLDRRVWETLRLVTDDNCKARTVDGSGNYSISVKPGTYIVYMKSKNRTSVNFSEIMGKIYCKKIKVNDGDTRDVSHNFDL